MIREAYLVSFLFWIGSPIAQLDDIDTDLRIFEIVLCSVREDKHIIPANCQVSKSKIFEIFHQD